MNRKSIRWTIENAAAEFGINPRTLSARLKQAGTVPGEDGRYSTKEIASAVFGDLEREKIRKTSAEADEIEKRNRERDGELVDVEEFAKEFDDAAVECVRVIESSALSNAEKDTLRNALADVFDSRAETSA